MRAVILFYLFYLGCVSAQAQWVKVVDESGMPIPYVSLQFGSSQRSFISNTDGMAYLETKPLVGERIFFRHVSYESKELEYDSSDTLHVSLKTIIYDLEALEVRVTNEKALFQEAIRQMKAGLENKKQLALSASYGRLRMKGGMADLAHPHFLTLSDGLFFSAMPYNRNPPRSFYQAQYGANGYLGDKVGIWVDADSDPGKSSPREIHKVYRRLFAFHLEMWNDGLLHLFSSGLREASHSFAEGMQYYYQFETIIENVRVTLDVDAESGSPKRLQLRLLKDGILVNNTDNLWINKDFIFQVDYSIVSLENGSSMAIPAFVESRENTATWKVDDKTYHLRFEWDYRPRSSFLLITTLKPKDKEDFFLGYNSLFAFFDEQEWKATGMWDDFVRYAGISLQPAALLPYNTFQADGSVGVLYRPSIEVQDEGKANFHKERIGRDIRQNKAVLAQIPH